MKRHGGHVMVIGSHSGIGLAATRLARHEGTEVTIAGRSPEILLQAPRELEKMHAVVMDITDEGSVEKGFAGLSRVDHGLISAGTIRNSTIVHNSGSWSPLILR